MSIIAAPIAATVTIAAAQRKVFSAQNFTGMLAGFVPFADSEAVKPSFIKMNKATAAAAMGGKASPVSFVSGLLFNISAYAYGQGKVDALAAGLPPVAAFAVQHACGLVKHGAGIDAATLKTATLSALEAVCALPVKAKAAALNGKTEAAAIEGESKRVDDEAAAAPLSTGDIKEAAAMLRGAGDNEAVTRVEAEEAAAAAKEAAALQAEEAAAAAAAIATQTREAYILSKAAEKVADIAVNRAIAAAEFAALAEVFGIKLTVAQQRKVDAFVADGEAAADSAAAAAMAKAA